MKSRAVLTAAILTPLTACFEPTIPYDPPAAELEQGEWLFAMDAVSVEGDCYGMGLDDADDLGRVLASAWVETHGERGVSITLVDTLLEGEIWGESLQADGLVDYGYGTDTVDPDPIEVDPDPIEDGEDEDEDETPVTTDNNPTMIHQPAQDLPEENIFVTMDADILAADHMQGFITVDYAYFDTYCSIEFEFDGEALGDDRCDCDCDDAPLTSQSGSSEPSDGGESSDGCEVGLLPA